MSTFAASAALRQGDLAAAEEHARTAVDTDAMQPVPLLTPFARAMLAGTLIELDELDDADAELRAATPEPGTEPPTISWVRLLGIRGRLRLAQGRFEEALESSLACGAQLELHRQTGVATHPWRSEASLALHAMGRSQEALRMVADELERAEGFGAPRAIGIALRTFGLIEGGAAGIARLARAVRVLEGSEARLEHGVALYELGAALRRANRRAEARDPLRAALDVAVRAGARRLRNAAEEELRATGARPRRLMLSGIDSLTASERRVARLAAEGRTNREIAQSLFVTPRTVEGHLTAVYRKLDIGSRDALPAALAVDSAG
jgi:DNA-binding CsgD family transcriptional regulator